MKLQTSRACMFAALLCPMLAGAPVMAAAPSTLLVEGAIHNLAGGPVADGNYTLTFTIWSAEQGGVAAWTEGPVTVKAEGGRFSYALGSKNPLDAAKLAALSSQWLGIRVGGEPEQPRRRMHATAFALTTANVSCIGCIKTSALSASYAGSTSKGGPAVGLECTGCVGVKQLKIDGQLDLHGNALRAGRIILNGDLLGQGAVQATKFIGDGSQLTGIKSASGSCPSGQVMTGIDGNGKPICKLVAVQGAAKGLSNTFTDQLHGAKAAPIPDYAKDGLLDTIEIPDVGVVKSFEVVIELTKAPFVDEKPKDGIADYDPSDLTVLLFPPTTKALPSPRSNVVNNFLTKPTVNGTLFPHYILAQGEGKGTLSLYKTYPTKDQPVSGDLTQWVGKNPKGKWRLWVIDNGDRIDTDGTDLKVDGKLLDWQIRLTTSNDKQIRVKGSQFVGGTLWGKYQGHGGSEVGAPLKVGGGIQVGTTSTKCDASTEGVIRYNKALKGLEFCNGTAWSASGILHGGATYRWAVFSTYDQAQGWFADRRKELYLGIDPQKWGDGNACIHQISSDADIWRTMFTLRGPPIGTLKNAVVYAEAYRNYSSTNSRHAVALFRVRNTTSKAITWRVSWYGTGFGGWGERRSVTINGQNLGCYSGTYGADDEMNHNISVPPNRTSSVIFMAASSNPSGDLRSCYLAFYNNSLRLPAGLEFVDDLDTKPSGWDK